MVLELPLQAPEQRGESKNRTMISGGNIRDIGKPQ